MLNLVQYLIIFFQGSKFKMVVCSYTLLELNNKEERLKLISSLWKKTEDYLVRFLFDLILYVPSTIFQLCREGSSWVEPVLS